MRFSLVSLALCAVTGIAAPIDTSSVTSLVEIPDTSSVTSLAELPDTSDLLDTSSLAVRQQHPGPGKSGPLYQLLGAQLYHEISLLVHTVGISVAKTEQALNQQVTALDPELGDSLHDLLAVVDTLEADLVSLGFNT